MRKKSEDSDKKDLKKTKNTKKTKETNEVQSVKKTKEPKTEKVKNTKKKEEKETVDLKVNFKIGDTVVYPFHGIGKITKKEKHEINGKEVQFCVINIPANQMNISLPLFAMKEKGIRFLMDKESLKNAISSISKNTDNQNMDWKMRQQTNNILVKKGDIESSIKVITSLYSRNKEKELPLQEKRIYESTLSVLSEEISLVFNITKKEAQEEILKKLEKI